jgi:hypothetical protein
MSLRTSQNGLRSGYGRVPEFGRVGFVDFSQSHERRLTPGQMTGEALLLDKRPCHASLPRRFPFHERVELPPLSRRHREDTVLDEINEPNP